MHGRHGMEERQRVGGEEGRLGEAKNGKEDRTQGKTKRDESC